MPERGGRMSVPLWGELRRRRVFRALVGYAVAAFAVLQVIEPVMHGLHWPDGVLSYVVVALAAGFPIVVTLAWIFDVQGGRLERTEARAWANGVRWCSQASAPRPPLLAGMDSSCRLRSARF